MTPKTRAEKEGIIQSILGLKLNETFALRLAEPLPESECRAITELTTAQQHMTPVDTFHGGLLGACLDTCALMACLNSLATDEHAVTVSSAMQIIAGVAGIGQKMTFEMRLMKRTRRFAFLEGVCMSDGRLIAKATITKAIVQAPAPIPTTKASKL